MSRLREAEAGEADELVVDRVRCGAPSIPLPRQPSTKRGRNASIASSLRLRLIARRKPLDLPTLNPAAAIEDVEHLILGKTTTPSVSAKSGSRGATRARPGRRSSGRQRRRWRLRCRGARPSPGSGRAARAATCTVRSSEGLGPRAQEGSASAQPALDLEEADEVGVRGISLVDLGGRRAGSGTGRSPRRAASRSARSASSTAESIPEPEQTRSSGSRHPGAGIRPCPTGRSGGLAIAAGCTGTRSISGRVEMIIPPGCWDMWRGRPAISWVSSRKACQRGPEWSPGTEASSPATPVACQPSVTRARRSSSANGRPSAFPTSRIAPRLR